MQGHKGSLLAARRAEAKENPAPKFISMEPVGGPQSCSFPIQWELCPVGGIQHRNLNSYLGLHSDRHLNISAIRALGNGEQEEYFGNLNPKVIMCFRHLDGP